MDDIGFEYGVNEPCANFANEIIFLDDYVNEPCVCSF